jgi:antitoxin CcdA
VCFVGANAACPVVHNGHQWQHASHAINRSNAVTLVSHHATPSKRATNVSLAENLLTEAKAFRINVSQAAERGLVQAIAEKRAENWLAENREAIESSNAFVERHGLPLESYRIA